MSEEAIQALIWIELVNSETNAVFMEWLVKNFDIKPKSVIDNKK